jgi:hypothetical protein
MQTVIETATFQKRRAALWTDDEYDEFIDYIARHPKAGDVIQGAQGARKVRWKRQGTGKSGGVRVIYVHYAEDGIVYLVTIYAKSERGNITRDEIREFRT